MKVLNELEKAMKRYHAQHGESKIAEGKLRYIESQKQKVEQHSSKGTLSRKLKSIEKQTEKVGHRDCYRWLEQWHIYAKIHSDNDS